MSGMTEHDHPSPESEPGLAQRPGSALSRRNVLVGLSAASVLATAGWAGPAQAAPPTTPGAKTLKLTVMGTSDLHCNVLNWDYYKDAAYSDSKGNAVGLARAASVVKQIRADRGAERTLLFDAGDTIQGTPLGFYYATVEPVTETGAIHPMAAQMNALGYDAVALGNHEFNYGLDFLDTWISQMDAPVLGANAVHAGTKVPAYRPYVIKTIKVKGLPPVRVGVLGLTNPGIVIWDKANVAGRIEVQDLVESAARWVPVMRQEGADIVVVSAHSGNSGLSSYGPELPVENAAGLVATQVPGIDAVLFGHAHKEVNATVDGPSGKVYISEPLNWGMRVSVFDLDLEFAKGSWRVVNGTVATVDTRSVVEDPEVAAVIADQHAAVVSYVNQVVAQSTAELSAAESCWKDTAILDYVNHVQVATVSAAIAGTPEASLPVVSIAAPFNRAAKFPAGPVTIKDVAGLYIYDNTLMASVLTGAQIAEYLEYSAKYFTQVAPGAPVAPETWTNANGTPDYNYDQFSGLEYGVDVEQPVGSRIVGLSYQGVPVTPDQRFVVAINNYRQSGGGGFPHVTTAPVVYNAQVAIREAIVSYASAQGTIDPAEFHVENWRLLRGGVPVF